MFLIHDVCVCVCVCVHTLKIGLPMLVIIYHVSY